MKKAARNKKGPPLGLAALDELIEEITTDAYGEDEQLWAFRQAFEDNVALPGEGTVVGEPVLVIAFDYDGNERRGLTAKCRGADGREHMVAAADVTMPPATPPAACSRRRSISFWMRVCFSFGLVSWTSSPCRSS